MKKYFFSSLLVLLLFFSKTQAQYDEGFQAGFSLAYQMVNDLVQQHPEYGIVSNQSVPVSPTFDVGTYWTMYTAANSLASALGLPPVPYSPPGLHTWNYINYYGTLPGVSYSAYQAGQIVNNHFWATGAYSYLENNSTLGGWHLGVYHGFAEGVVFWLIQHN